MRMIKITASASPLALPARPAGAAIADGWSLPATTSARDTRPTVLHFIHTIGGGGAEAMLVSLASSLSSARFRSVVVAVTAKPWPHLVRRLTEAGVTVHDLEGSAFLQPATLSRLRAVLRAERPDIVQTWMHHADLIGGWMARLAGVRRVVWSVHCREIHRNPGDSDRKTAVFRQALGLSSRFIPSRVVSCSAAAMEDHAALGYPRARMRWIPNGIDAELFKPDANAALDTREDLKLPRHVPVVGFVGRFHEMKDLATFLRAAALLQARLPQAHFVLCGGVEVQMSEEERALLDLLPHRDQVRFESFRPDPWRLYPALNVFSLSSRTEACPMTVIEAMACGVPCVTTDVGDCARLLEGVGLVVPARDPDALAAAWEKTLRLPPLDCQGVRERSRQRVLEHFSIAQVAHQYAETYTELLEGRK